MNAPATDKVNLLDFDQQGLRDYFVSIGEKPFRALQLMKWIYRHYVTDFEEMTDLGVKLRAKLAATAEIRAPEVVMAQPASDGTTKWLMRLDSGNSVETVYIPDGPRATLCVSSQVGCALDCSFCATAREGFNRNLTTAEMIGQVWQVTRMLRESEEHAHDQLTNVVMMGMGEPLLNLTNLVPALSLMVDDLAYGLSKRKVTVSTSGIVPNMDRLREQIDVALAVSLHAPTDELRNELVPINKKYPIDELMGACRRYVADEARKRHVMFEYVMLAGVNDRPQDARALVKLLKGMACKVNLIPFNPFPGSGYETSQQPAIDRFWEILNKAGIRCLMRRTRGDDVAAACGQLAGEVADRSRRPLRFVEPRFGERA